MEQHLFFDSLVQILYISKLDKKENEKNTRNQAETVSSMGLDKEFYILLKLAITHYCPWLVLAFKFMH